MSSYFIEYRPEVFDDLNYIPRNIQKRIKRSIEQRLNLAPDIYGERLRRSLLGLWKIRVGEYRVVYEIRGHKIIIWVIMHRDKVYSEAERRWKLK